MPSQQITLTLMLPNDPVLILTLTVFIPGFLLLRTIKRALPSLLGGG